MSPPRRGKGKGEKKGEETTRQPGCLPQRAPGHGILCRTGSRRLFANGLFFPLVEKCRGGDAVPSYISRRSLPCIKTGPGCGRKPPTVRWCRLSAVARTVGSYWGHRMITDPPNSIYSLRHRSDSPQKKKRDWSYHSTHIELPLLSPVTLFPCLYFVTHLLEVSEQEAST